VDRLAVEQESGPRMEVTFDSDDVQRAFTKGRDQPDWMRRGEPWEFYADDQILARQKRWREEDERAARSGTHAFGHDDYEDYHDPYVREVPKLGRNDPCHCGSGRKYKKCCLPLDEASAAAQRALH
jgi:hypothetical protein